MGAAARGKTNAGYRACACNSHGDRGPLIDPDGCAQPYS